LTGSSEAIGLTDLAANLKILLLDVDGVLTDGGIILIGESDEAKRFNVQDGMGVNLARAAGLRVGIVTSRESAVVKRRAAELNIDDLFQGIKNKPEVLDLILGKYGIQANQAAFIGDDIQDISIMKRVGIPIAVQNAVQQIKDHSVYVTKASGGNGAVREAVEWLLDIRGDKDKVLEPFLS
jgi:3-deoxy-D-manno-octulosonate 8-phosphate phosphatase (KDO 8-P phosphatase)